MRNEFIGQVTVPLNSLLDLNDVIEHRVHGGPQKFLNKWFKLRGRDGEVTSGSLLLSFRLELPQSDAKVKLKQTSGEIESRKKRYN